MGPLEDAVDVVDVDGVVDDVDVDVLLLLWIGSASPNMRKGAGVPAAWAEGAT